MGLRRQRVQTLAVKAEFRPQIPTHGRSDTQMAFVVVFIKRLLDDFLGDCFYAFADLMPLKGAAKQLLPSHRSPPHPSLLCLPQLFSLCSLVYRLLQTIAQPLYQNVNHKIRCLKNMNIAIIFAGLNPGMWHMPCKCQLVLFLCVTYILSPL